MTFANTCVAALLKSPFHGVLSGSTDLIRYQGRRSGDEFTTPTQYARLGDDVVILVGKPDTKTWWRNFRTEHPLDVRIRGHWLPMTATALVGPEQADDIVPLLDVYLRRFPRAASTLGEGSTRERAERAVVVRCRPR